jgi:sugar phosphate isomerase/epimerase
MRTAVCSWSLRPSGPEELVSLLRDTKIMRVQLALVPCVEDPARWGHACTTLREAGIGIVSGMLATVGEDYSTLESIARTGGVRSDRWWNANLDRAIRVAEFAAAQGIALVTFHAGFIPHERGAPERLMTLDRLRTVIDIFAQRGVDVAFETGQESATTLSEALDDLGRPRAGVNFDPANMILYGMGDPVGAVRTLAARIRQVHIKDALPTSVPGTWGREVRAGDGHVQWPKFLEAVREANVAAGRDREDVDLVIEREAGAARAGDVAHALEMLRSLGA